MRWKLDRGVEAELISKVYPLMRKLAAKKMRGMAGAMTISPTELAHEVYFRVREQVEFDWKNQCQFIALLSTITRRVIIDYLRHRNADKRHGAQVLLSLDGPELANLSGDLGLDWHALDQALTQLSKLDFACAQVAELKLFSDMDAEAIAAALDCSVATIGRHWRFARAWLTQTLA